MSYITEVADAIRSEVDPRLVPEGDTASLFRLYAVLALAKGTAVTPEDVHNAWAAWMSGNDPTHASIQPFDALSPTVQREDAPFVDGIRTVAARLTPRDPQQIA